MKKNEMALILSGGGARGAYEAGVLLYIREMLPQKLRQINFPILSGTSVGAINITYWASTAHTPLQQGKKLAALWSNLKSSSVYQLAILSSLKSLIQGHSHALLDTTPLKKFISKNIDWKQIKKNIDKNYLESLTLVGTRMRTGEVELFVQSGSRIPKDLPFQTRSVELNTDYVMASAAIPLVFPSVLIENKFYVDGGVRINTPLAPSIHLGAKKLFIIALHSDHPDTTQNKLSEIDNPPSLGEHLGKLLNLFFLDKLKHDLDQLQLINKLIEAGERRYGSDYLKEVNSELKGKKEFSKIQTLVIKPSIPISSLFQDWYEKKSNASISTFLESLLLKLFDVNPALSTDLLSYLTFEKGYLQSLIDLGFEDARMQHNTIVDFFDSTSKASMSS